MQHKKELALGKEGRKMIDMEGQREREGESEGGQTIGQLRCHSLQKKDRKRGTMPKKRKLNENQ